MHTEIHKCTYIYTCVNAIKLPSFAIQQQVPGFQCGSVWVFRAGKKWRTTPKRRDWNPTVTAVGNIKYRIYIYTIIYIFWTFGLWRLSSRRNHLNSWLYIYTVYIYVYLSMCVYDHLYIYIYIYRGKGKPFRNQPVHYTCRSFPAQTLQHAGHELPTRRKNSNTFIACVLKE